MPFFIPPIVWGLSALAATVAAAWGGKKLYDNKKAQDAYDEKIYAKYSKIILLQGAQASGKDTILHIIKGEGFQSRASTIKPFAEEVVSDWLIINTSGSESTNSAKEKWRRNIREIFKGNKGNDVKDSDKQALRDKLLWLHLFDMQEYEKNRLKILADRNEAKGDGWKFVAIGTHLDKVNASTDKDIRSELESSGIRCFTYDMTKNPKDDIKEMIKSI